SLMTITVRRPLAILCALAYAAGVLAWHQPKDAYAYYLLLLAATLVTTAAGKQAAKRRWSGWREVAFIASAFLPAIAGAQGQLFAMLAAVTLYCAVAAWYLRPCRTPSSLN
ncbi:MAG: hypothetical protein ABR591_05365, partial [Candidatus Velthaea sp.]